MELKDFKMVADKDTAYDEVIADINGLAHFMVECKNEEWRTKTRKLITKKCGQLMRLLNDDDSEYEEGGIVGSY